MGWHVHSETLRLSERFTADLADVGTRARVDEEVLIVVGNVPE